MKIGQISLTCLRTAGLCCAEP